jgi:hypothetical protein
MGKSLGELTFLKIFVILYIIKEKEVRKANGTS